MPTCYFSPPVNHYLWMGDFPFTLTELRLRPVVNWTNVDEQILAPSVISMSNGFNMHDSLDLLGPPLYMIHISKLEHPEATIHVRSVDHQPNSQVFSKQGQSEKVTMTALHGVDDKNLQLIQGVDDKNLQLPHDQELHGERIQKATITALHEVENLPLDNSSTPSKLHSLHQSLDDPNLQLPQGEDGKYLQLPQCVDDPNLQLPQSVDDKNLQLPHGVDDKNLQLPQGVDDKNLQLPQGVDDKNLQLPQGVDDKILQLPQGVDDKNLQLPYDQELHGERVQKSLPAHCNEYQVFKAQLPGLHNQELHGERVQESLQAHSNEYQVLKAQLPGLHNQELHGERVQESLHAHSNESQVFKAKLPGLHKKTHLATFFSSASAKMRLALGLAHTNLQLPHSLAHASLRLPHCVAQTNMRHPHIVNEMRSRLSHGRSFGSLADEISVLSKYYYFAKDGICQEGDVRGFKMATKSPSDINNTIHGSDEVGSVESNLSESIMYGSDEVKSFESERIENTMDG
ncbi:uncharacterized protein LOC127858920 isoform X3 [Dreissena polymorpha]|uniref:uncharacterized protein LOC127858920 isoform X3 n=1 Tax=Dreissena polymorpha TaxID=45954 RepID=UPI0022655E3E|nr:uncharacterized protein LOC127858920 isoform X3 [Dreissena polymorpha]